VLGPHSTNVLHNFVDSQIAASLKISIGGVNHLLYVLVFSDARNVPRKIEDNPVILGSLRAQCGDSALDRLGCRLLIREKLNTGCGKEASVLALEQILKSL